MKIKKLCLFLLILLAFSQVVISQDKIKLYSEKISSKDVNGTNKFGPKNAKLISKIFGDPIIRSNSDDNAIKGFLGRFVIIDLRSPSALLNLASNKTLNRLLDELNFEYYEDYAIPNILDRDVSFSTNENYIEFKSAISSLNTIDDKKKLLFKEEYSIVRQKLEDSRLDFVSIDIANEQKLIKTIKSKLEANISAALSENDLNLGAGVKQELTKIVDRNVKINGSYIEVYFRPEYLDKVVFKLDRYKKLTDKPDDEFSTQLNSYYNNDKTTIVTSVAAIKIKVDYETTNTLKNNIEAFLKANFTIDESKLAKAKIDILASFDVDRKFNGTASLQHYFILRYGYDSRLKNFLPKK